MAAGLSNLFSQLGKLGIGLAVVGGVANSALYNGKGIKKVTLYKFVGFSYIMIINLGQGI